MLYMAACKPGGPCSCLHRHVSCDCCADRCTNFISCLHLTAVWPVPIYSIGPLATNAGRLLSKSHMLQGIMLLQGRYFCSLHYIAKSFRCCCSDRACSAKLPVMLLSCCQLFSDDASLEHCWTFGSQCLWKSPASLMLLLPTLLPC